MLLLLSLLGCHGDCGDYTVSTGVWVDHTMGDLWTGDPSLDPAFDTTGHDVYPLDGDYYEMCGVAWGTFGSWNPLGDGWSTVFFRLDHRDFDLDINGLFIEMQVLVPTSAAVAGTTVSTESGQLLGDARLIDGSGEPFKLSPLTEGSFTFTSGELSSDVCTEEEGPSGYEGPVFGASWDLVFENAGEQTRFTANGSDKIWFDVLSAADCWDW